MARKNPDWWDDDEGRDPDGRGGGGGSTGGDGGGGGDDRAERERRGLEVLTRYGIDPSDRGNWESYLSGRADLDEFTRDTARRAEPTASAGGRGGDADVNNDARIDPGWVQNAGGQYVRTPITGGPTTVTGGGQPWSVGSFGGGGYPGIPGGDVFRAAPSTGTAPITLGAAYQYQPFTETFTAPPPPADLMDPWTRTFVAPERPADLMDPWTRMYTRPTAADLQTDPGVQVRLEAQQRAMERSAAAKGTLLTGGFQRSLGEVMQDYASNEYQRLVDRATQEYLNAFKVFTGDKSRRASVYNDQFGQSLAGHQTDFNTFLGDKDRRSREYGNTYGRALGEFGQRFDTHQANQLNAFNIGRAGRLDDFNIGRTTKMDDFGISDTNRRFGFDVDRDLWGRNRTGYMDDFNIWRTLNRDWTDDNFRLADFGRPLA